MTIDLDGLLAPYGVRPTADVVDEVGRSSVGRWLTAGRLVRPLPGVLATPAAIGTWRGRATAAVQWSGGQLAGRTALAVWDLTGHPGAHIHLGVGRSRNVPALPVWLRVHRVDGAARFLRDGFVVTGAARSLVDTWGYAHAGSGTGDQVRVARSAVIGALRRRVVTAPALWDELAQHRRLPGRAALGELVSLVDAGCQSEFEVWGLRQLLDVPGLPPVPQQYPLQTRAGLIHLDGAWPAARLGVELDGAEYHRQPDQREYDLRRDAAALAEGWVTLRISYRRAHAEPGACRAELATVHALRTPSRRAGDAACQRTAR